MQYDVVIGERTRKVVVLRAGEAWRVTVDDVPYEVQATRVDRALLSLLVGQGAAIPSRSVPAVVVAGKAAGTLGVHVNGRQLAVTVSESGRARRRAAIATPSFARWLATASWRVHQPQHRGRSSP